jgi:ABC-type uncharacterized transport system permease subunit
VSARAVDRLAVVAFALLATYVAFGLVVLAYGESPARMAGALLEGTLGSAYGIGQVLFKATPLLFAGVAIDVGLRAKLFNVGAEGQIAVASLVSAVVGAGLPSGTPRPVAWLVVVAAAMLAGALWAMPPALLKARRGVHEVLSTVLMNKVARRAPFAGARVGARPGRHHADAGRRTVRADPQARRPLGRVPWVVREPLGRPRRGGRVHGLVRVSAHAGA